MLLPQEIEIPLNSLSSSEPPSWKRQSGFGRWPRPNVAQEIITPPGGRFHGDSEILAPCQNMGSCCVKGRVMEPGCGSEFGDSKEILRYNVAACRLSPSPSPSLSPSISISLNFATRLYGGLGGSVRTTRRSYVTVSDRAAEERGCDIQMEQRDDVVIQTCAVTCGTVQVPLQMSFLILHSLSYLLVPYK